MRVLELRGISKSFGVIQALSDVSLAIDAGEVVGLMGDNGAGKSTLVKIVAGNFLPSEGEIRINGAAKRFHRPVDARVAGLFKEFKSETRPRDLVKHMSGGQRQAVAIARTRLSDAKIVLMDEPTAAISVRQVAEVLDLIRRLRDAGIAIILISHRMPDVFAVCDRIAVLRRGRQVAEKAIAETSPEEVTGLITGAIASA